ncbi:hypothetical protein Taro_030963 [Colocasia esculenta]|uniref:Pentatricopeptide repeat-containing protein n=1 Tax=Colocasia esculenta TaxID=4460 RepID=A0A843VQK1_COLES|nr:hypothetical protein [Colocasia esculenta]
MGRADDAVSVFETMVAGGLPPALHCYALLINGYCKNERIDDALNLFFLITRKSRPVWLCGLKDWCSRAPRSGLGSSYFPYTRIALTPLDQKNPGFTHLEDCMNRTRDLLLLSKSSNRSTQPGSSCPQSTQRNETTAVLRPCIICYSTMLDRYLCKAGRFGDVKILYIHHYPFCSVSGGDQEEVLLPIQLLVHSHNGDCIIDELAEGDEEPHGAIDLLHKTTFTVGESERGRKELL